MNAILLLLGIYLGVAGFTLLFLTILCAWAERTVVGAWILGSLSIQLLIQRALVWPHTIYILIGAYTWNRQ